MSTDLFRITYAPFYRNISTEELSFLQSFFPAAEDGTISVDKDALTQALKKAKKGGRMIPRKLVSLFSKEVKHRRCLTFTIVT